MDVGLEAQRARVAAQAEQAGLALVRFLYCDNDGVIRGKVTGLSRLAERLETGIGLAVAMQAFTMLDQLAPVKGMGPVGEIRLVPDPATFVIAPYAPRTGVVLVDMMTQGRQPYMADGRYFLKRMIERATADGIHLMAAFEPEWSLVGPDGNGGWKPVDQSLCYSSYGMDTVSHVVDELVGALEAQGLPVEQYHPELGWGQQELSIRHAPGLRAADNHLLYRTTVRAVAMHHGLDASFAPKPWPEQAGNGCHLHFSCWDATGSINHFAEPGAPGGISAMARCFMAGVLAHLPGLLALTCASVNSYRRLQPQIWASAYRAWGFDNREAVLRVASPFWGHEVESANIELKACDSSCNPYLALGGVMAAGMDGLEHELELPPPLSVDPHTLSDEERAAVGAQRHPASLAVALDALERDEVLMSALGDRLSAAYLAVKRLDVERFAAQDDAFELSQHRFKF